MYIWLIGDETVSGAYGLNGQIRSTKERIENKRGEE